MHQTKHTPKITTTEPMSAPTVKTKPLQGQPLYHHRVVEGWCWVEVGLALERQGYSYQACHHQAMVSSLSDGGSFLQILQNLQELSDYILL